MRTTPATIVPTVVADPQPSVPASMKPYVSAVRPALDSSVPTMSILGLRTLRDSGMSQTTATRAISTIGTLIRKTEPHQ